MPPDTPAPLLGHSEQRTPRLNYVEITLCDACLDGQGGECHVPGCGLWMACAPDIPIRDKAHDVTPYREGPVPF